MNAVYPNCVDWVWIRVCGACERPIPVGTEHTQVIEHEEHSSHLPHEMPITYFHPRCAPGLMVDLNTPLHPNGLEAA